jgi:hypothetical protein
MIFTPFAFMASQAAPAWSPADFTNVQYWWTADAGVTDDGSGNVETWTDQINSYDLQQSTTANMPSITTQANLNGQNVVSFNGTSDFIYATVAPASLSNADVTFLTVYYLGSTTPGAGIIFGNSYVGGSNGRMWLDGLNNTQRWWDSWANFGTGRTLENPITTGGHAFKGRYDASAGDTFAALDTLTETAGTVGGATNQDYSSTSVFCMGATLNSFSNPTVFSSRYIAVDIAEAVVVHGSPTAQEMTDWQTYVNNKYGTIIT